MMLKLYSGLLAVFAFSFLLSGCGTNPVTHKKELKAIFRRLWNFKDTQPQRDQHLDLSIAELKELRATLQMIK